MLRFFGRISQDKEFAIKLVQKLAQDVPPITLSSGGKAVSVNRVTRLLERTFSAAYAYQVEHGMGFVRRAIFANTFNWELKSVKYSDEFSKIATEGLVVALSKKVVV